MTGGGPGGQDFFSNVNAVVTNLFSDEGISISQSGSFSPGSGTGTEFNGDRLSVGFDITPNTVSPSTKTFTFVSLPVSTLFISFKEANGFELFKVPGSTPFQLTHSLGNGTSHISTFAGTRPVEPDPEVIPLPAAGLLLLGSLGGLALLRARKKS